MHPAARHVSRSNFAASTSASIFVSFILTLSLLARSLLLLLHVSCLFAATPTAFLFCSVIVRIVPIFKHVDDFDVALGVVGECIADLLLLLVIKGVQPHGECLEGSLSCEDSHQGPQALLPAVFEPEILIHDGEVLE